MEPAQQKVTITDVSMPFGSMVIFIFKWSVASIPALILLIIVGAVFAGIFGGLISGLAR